MCPSSDQEDSSEPAFLYTATGLPITASDIVRIVKKPRRHPVIGRNNTIKMGRLAGVIEQECSHINTNYSYSHQLPNTTPLPIAFVASAAMEALRQQRVIEPITPYDRRTKTWKVVPIPDQNYLLDRLQFLK